MRTFALLLIGVLAGCTTAGPFVADISSNGDGELTVTKCKLEANAYTGTISNNDCTTNYVDLSH